MGYNRVSCPICDRKVKVDKYTEYLECPECGTIIIDKRIETITRPWE